jgi:hypothetical protein
MIRISQWDAAWTQDSGVSVEAQQAPDVPTQQVDQSTVPARQRDLVVEVEIVPLTIQVGKLVRLHILMPNQGQAQFLEALIGDIFRRQPASSHLQSLTDFKKLRQFGLCQRSYRSAQVRMAND